MKSKILNFFSWADGTEALRDALTMEKQVSIAIKGLITLCEGVEDFYSADYLTGTWLEEQLHGQRELAGMINTLSAKAWCGTIGVALRRADVPKRQ